MYKGHRIAVVMPIHNEEGHLVKALSRVPAFVDLIIAVDDGSTDGTWHQLNSVQDARLVRLRNEKNLGVGAATRLGYQFGFLADAEMIAVMDGDGQMDGRDLPGLLDCAMAGADYVKGNRFMHRDTLPGMPWGRLVGNVVLSWLTRKASSFEGDLDAQCGFTVIRAASLRRLDLEGLYARYGFPNEMFFAAHRAGLEIRSVPVRTIYDNEMSGINPFTAVPTIIYLIARGFARRVLSIRRVDPVLSIQRTGGDSAD
jgi:glycosyltransferase involved in cell wall biosynthesis